MNRLNRLKQLAALAIFCVGNAMAALPNTPVSYAGAGENLATVAVAIEKSLGAKVILRGNVGDRIINGKYVGATGAAFLDNFATGNRLAWDYSRNQVIIGDESEDLRVSKVSGANPSSFSKVLYDPKSSDKYGLMIFQVQNAQVEDRRVPSNGVPKIIPGVTTLFRQFIGVPAPKVTTTPAAPANTNTPQPPATASGQAQSSIMGLFIKNAAPIESSEFIGDNNVRGVYSDVRLNAVLVRDKVEHFENYREIIRLLDRPADMVQLEAFIVDIQKDQVQELGINLGLGGDIATNLILQPFKARNFAAKIKALETNGQAQTLSVPSVVSLNNEQALFSSRQNFYISVAGQYNATVNQVTAETQLLVTPQIANESPDVPFDERRVKVLINIQDAAANANTTTSSTDILIAKTSTSSLPTTTENQITTQAVVRSGDSLVIGGQVVRKKIDKSSGLPGAQSTGIFSFLFSEKTSEFHDYVRVYVVRPKILGEDSVSANAITAGTSARQIANKNIE